MKKRIIDAHSHIGVDAFYPFSGDINEYVKKADKMGITDSLIMSVPSPVLNIGNRYINQLLWKYQEGSNQFKYQFLNISDYISNPSLQIHPYALSNFITQLTLNECNTDINLHFIPLVHPTLDSEEYLIKLLEQKPIALKIHGIASGIIPEQISNEFWKIIQKYNVPIIVHTDFDDTGNTSPIFILRNGNTAIRWINVFEHFNIRAFLTHGVRLCKESIKRVNNSNLFVVGIGPDSLISIEPNRLMRNTNYLETLFENLSIDKLCLDLDYPWNVNKPISVLNNPSTDLDFNIINRIEALKISPIDLDKVLYFNAAKFFNI